MGEIFVEVALRGGLYGLGCVEVGFAKRQKHAALGLLCKLRERAYAAFLYSGESRVHFRSHNIPPKLKNQT
ncbi:hypothetical protein SDC9_192802 [bioreactor metagenome]|uniref:Uncharacterized protein n=1 Tax=bioreactor metagenome TaxID=1076179 RepID=A0A645I1T4_9ZZZZ